MIITSPLLKAANALMIMGMTGIRSFLYKEDFNKFIKALDEAVDHVKTQLMPDFDFDAFNRDNVPSENGESEAPAAIVDNEKTESTPTPTTADKGNHEDVDKW